MITHSYDLVVIGSGPAGEKGAAQAAYFGKRVALAEQKSILGGVACNGGTLSSKTLRDGRATPRVCITNFRTRAQDVEAIVQASAEIGAELASSSVHE